MDRWPLQHRAMTMAQDDHNPTYADVGAGTYADLGPAHGVYAVAKAQGVGLCEATTC